METAGATYVSRWTTSHAKKAIKSIKGAIEHKGFSFVEIIAQCPTNFGRRALSTGDAVKGMEWIKSRAITVKKAADLNAEEMAKKYLVGDFVNIQRPIFEGSSVDYDLEECNG